MSDNTKLSIVVELTERQVALIGDKMDSLHEEARDAADNIFFKEIEVATRPLN